MRRGVRRSLELLLVWLGIGVFMVSGVCIAWSLGTKHRLEREAREETQVSVDPKGLDPLVGTLTIDDHIFDLQRADQIRLRDIRQLKHRIETIEKKLGIIPPVFDSEGFPVDGFKE